MRFNKKYIHFLSDVSDSKILFPQLHSVFRMQERESISIDKKIFSCDSFEPCMYHSSYVPDTPISVFSEKIKRRIKGDVISHLFEHCVYLSLFEFPISRDGEFVGDPVSFARSIPKFLCL